MLGFFEVIGGAVGLGAVATGMAAQLGLRFTGPSVSRRLAFLQPKKVVHADLPFLGPSEALVGRVTPRCKALRASSSSFQGIPATWLFMADRTCSITSAMVSSISSEPSALPRHLGGRCQQSKSGSPRPRRTSRCVTQRQRMRQMLRRHASLRRARVHAVAHACSSVTSHLAMKCGPAGSACQRVSWRSTTGAGRTIVFHRGPIRKALGFRESSVADADKLTKRLVTNVTQSGRGAERARTLLAPHARNLAQRARGMTQGRPSVPCLGRMGRSRFHSFACGFAIASSMQERHCAPSPASAVAQLMEPRG
jgi:hypothetical protein